MRRVMFSLLLSAVCFGEGVLLEGKLLTGVEVGGGKEVLPLLIEIEGSGCVIQAGATLSDTGRVLIRSERFYCGEEVRAVRGFVTDENGILGIRCSTSPCVLEVGTRVKVFLQESNIGHLLKRLLSSGR